MTTNHQLIIGLGGVGGRSIAAFKKVVETHKRDYEALTEENGSRFEYLYIDSNEDILNSDIWNVYGRSVKLERADYVMLKEAGTTSSIKEISQHKNIAPWIGRLEDHLAQQRGKVNIDDGSLDAELMGLRGAGQLRRYGRALFALHAQKIRNNIQSKIDKLIKDSDSSRIDVRIFCTLGGGTGSGSIIDMVTLIKSIANAKGHEYNTLVYTFVAGSSRNEQNAGSFYENEYAALRDLNALMVGKYTPDIAGYFGGEADNAWENLVKGGGSPLIQTIYISTEKTEGSPELSAQIDFMAKACFDTIMYSMLYKEGNAMKALSTEDFVQTNLGEPSSSNLLRSYRFAALGSKRWCVPTEEITELLKYDYELRVLDSWLKGAPLPSDVPPRNTNDTGDVFSPKSSKTWKAIEDFCEKERDTLRNIYEEINVKGKRDADTLRMLDDKSEKNAEKITQEMLSRLDIRRTIQNCADEDTTNMLTALKEKIDRLFRWGGVDAWGIENIQTYLDNYAGRVLSWEQELIETMTEQQVEKKRKDISGTMRKREAEWEKIGILTMHLTGKDERMINDQYEDCIQRIDLALRPFRLRSVRILMDKARNKVAELAAHVKTASDEIGNACSDIEVKIAKRLSELSINTKDGMSDQFEFDMGNLTRLRDAIKKLDDEHASEMIRTYSPEWDRIVGSFDKYEVNHIKTIRGTLYGAFKESSKHLHDSAVKRGTREGPLRDVITTSIFDYLTKQLAGQDAGPNYENWNKALGKKIENFVGKLRCSTFIKREGNALTEPQVPPLKAIAFGFPKNANPPPGFVEWLRDKLDTSLPSEFRPEGTRVDFYEHYTSSEIRVLYMPFWFPARFAPVVFDIYTHYERTAKKTDERARIYFANIDDEDNGLDSQIRPALTSEGDSNEENARKVDFACRIYLKLGDVKAPVAKDYGNRGIVIVKGIDADGIPQYSERYSAAEKTHPSGVFKTKLGSAIDLALKGMDEGEKRVIFSTYTEELKMLIKEGKDPQNDPDAKEAEQVREKAREWLGLND